jgi:ribosome-associated protein
LTMLLTRSLQKPKPRKATKVSKQAIEARLAGKKLNAQKKESRKRNFDA